MADQPEGGIGAAGDPGRLISDAEETSKGQQVGDPTESGQGQPPSLPSQQQQEQPQPARGELDNQLVNAQQQQQQQQQHPAYPMMMFPPPYPLAPPIPSFPPPPPQMQVQVQMQMDSPSSAANNNDNGNNNPSNMIRFYEAQMRDHAAAYACAAAGAAWAAAHWASQAAGGGGGVPVLPSPPPPPQMMMGPNMHNYYPNYEQQQSQPQQPQPQQLLPMMQEDQAFEPNPQYHYDQQQQQQQYPQQYQHQQQPSEEDYEHRRKRQQRSSPDDSSSLSQVPRVVASRPPPPAQPPRGKIRRRLRSDNDSSSSGSSFMRGSSGMKSGNSSGRGRGGYYHNKKKKARSNESLIGKTGVSAFFEWCGKQQLTPTFTLQQPVSPEEFECVVYLDRESVPNSNNASPEEQGAGVDQDALQEVGRGRGSNKNAAKQMAARLALQTLLPGVVFDAASGTLVALPTTATASVEAPRPTTASTAASNNKVDSCMDDLAPNLAKQLAIGRDNDPVDHRNNANKEEATGAENLTQKRIMKPKRSFGGYPSTTSEEENESTYYSSRGASVCSQLLYAIIQIDRRRVPDVPTFTYKVAPRPAADGTDSSKRPATSAVNAAATSFGHKTSVGRVLGGPFTCTGRLKVMSSAVARRQQDNDNEGDTADSEEHQTEQILEAVAAGGTKREARHVASAKLLAQLFPECENMAEVKAAAETMRERYAADKVLKQQVQYSELARLRDAERGSNDKTKMESFDQRPSTPQEGLAYAKALSSDPTLPVFTADALGALLKRADEFIAAESEQEAEEDLVSSVNAVVLSDSVEHASPLSTASASVFRQLSRQKQLDTLVESALQNLNDRDEEGRSLPEELTEADVGRTMLRRADPQDLSHIKKLFNAEAIGDNKESRTSRSRSFDSGSPTPLLATDSSSAPGAGPFLLESLSGLSDDFTATNNTARYCGRDNGSSSELMARLWSSSSIVLLLCRAIAPHEDPLGCAILTVRFSMASGRTLCLARGQVATEPHLPRERFIECLDAFAKCMRCKLEVEGSASSPMLSGGSTISLSKSDLVSIIESHVAVATDEKPRAVANKRSDLADGSFIPGTADSTSQSQQLQSVQEEESDVDDSSSVEKRTAKHPSKPSKRSRFA